MNKDNIFFLLNKVSIKLQYNILQLTFVGNIRKFLGKSLKKRLRRVKDIH